jgi:molybdopterin/thiamine biosynthesis adenylyltransferase
LRDKKIVLIGCGTIGGYLAHSLVQNGAGTGQGILSLYDHDRYSTSNIGRHILGGRYLRQIKSHAMKAFLTDDFFGQNLHIEASERFDYNRINLVAGYDLIIDATGDSQFSTLLSRSWHRFDSRKPPLLHGWIDAAGDVVRVLLDDGKNACYHCLANERLPLYSNGFTPRAIRHSCAGSSYFTFTSASSMSAAALTLNIAVKYLKGDKPLRFNQIKLAEEIRYTKNQNLNPTKGCPCCQI